jgi:hypothetical protein
MRLHDRQLDADQVEEWSPGAAMPTTAATGSTVGTGNAVAGGVIGALTKPADEIDEAEAA